MNTQASQGELIRPERATYRISDELWILLQSVLPQPKEPRRNGGGRMRVPDRVCANAIFYVLRTGCRWKALDALNMCSGSTAHARYLEWVRAGVFQRLWQISLERLNDPRCADSIDYSWLACFLSDKRGSSAKQLKSSIQGVVLSG